VHTAATKEPTGGWLRSQSEMTAVARGPEFVLNGVKHYVKYADLADYLHVTAWVPRRRAPDTFIVPRGLSGVEVQVGWTDAMESNCEVRFDDVAIPRGHLISLSTATRKLLSTTEADLESAYLIGRNATAAALWMTLPQATESPVGFAPPARTAAEIVQSIASHRLPRRRLPGTDS
jgi:alkylation response protein AidB-like acyl-CoA dehydrogenase